MRLRMALWGAGIAMLVVGASTGSGCTGDLGPAASQGDASAGSGANGSTTGGAGGAGGSDGASGGLGSGAYGGGTVEPSGYLLISKDQMTVLEQAAKTGDARYQALLANCDEYAGTFDIWHTSPENFALAYLLSGDSEYAREAYDWVATMMADEDVPSASYLYVGDILRPVAMVLNYCSDALSESERSALIDYLDRWVNELWFDNQGSGWGLEDPGNNYHMAFIQATAFAGYALRGVGHPNGQKYIDLAIDKLERDGGVMDYLDTRVRGGDWHEGANYGERSKQRLFSALSAIASMGDDNYFNLSVYFANSIYYALYATQPDRASLYPGGDLASDVAMPVSPYERDYLQTATYWLVAQEGARNYGQWYLDAVADTYDQAGYQGHMHKDLLYGLSLEAKAPDGALPLSFRAAGTDFIHARSAWTPAATSLSISGSPVIDQTHAHFDTGSFTLFKGGWQAVDAASYGDTGLNWGPDAHNMVHVAGFEREWTDTAGVLGFEDEGPFAVASIDASDLYRQGSSSDHVALLEEYTRELVYLRPGHLFVYDRVVATPAGADYDFRLHFASAPVGSSGSYQATNGDGGIAVRILEGGTVSLEDDDDLVDGWSSASRLSVAPTGMQSRFMAVLKVGFGGAPTLGAQSISTDSEAAGAVFDGQVVVVSSRAFGQAVTLPFSYSVSGPTERHVITNLAGPVDVDVSTSGGTTTVTVREGSAHMPSSAGAISFEL